ncbi:MAG: nitroreductase family protein [bacterium]
MSQAHEVMQVLLNRKSVRAYDRRPIGDEAKAAILRATLRAPTAGNLMLYSIIEVKDQAAKDTLAKTCDNQPFIAKAPLVLLFLADYQRWWDYFAVSGVEALARARGEPVRRPQEGDLMIACCDALIAAQTAVIAAESLGIGSCYIGDIMENYETHRALFGLPQYALPICLVCFGYPTKQQQERPLTPRFEEKFIVFEDAYRRLGESELREMFQDREARFARAREDGAAIHGLAAGGAASAAAPANVAQLMYLRKFTADFTREMTRSVRAMLRAWNGG